MGRVSDVEVGRHREHSTTNMPPEVTVSLTWMVWPCTWCFFPAISPMPLKKFSAVELQVWGKPNCREEVMIWGETSAEKTW